MIALGRCPSRIATPFTNRRTGKTVAIGRNVHSVRIVASMCITVLRSNKRQILMSARGSFSCFVHGNHSSTGSLSQGIGARGGEGGSHNDASQYQKSNANSPIAAIARSANYREIIFKRAQRVEITPYANRDDGDPNMYSALRSAYVRSRE